MEKKIYNLKQSSLGKISFLNGTCFVGINFFKFDGSKINEIVIMPSIEECIEIFPKLFLDSVEKHIDNPQEFKNKIINYLIDNWSIKYFEKLKIDITKKYNIQNSLNEELIEWIKSDSKILGLVLLHIAIAQKKGDFKLPEELNGIRIMIKFIKNILAVNFWDDKN